MTTIAGVAAVAPATRQRKENDMNEIVKAKRSQAERNEEIADKLEEFFNEHALDSRITADECVLLLKAVVALRGHETSEF